MSRDSIAPLFRSTEEQPAPLTATVTGEIPEWLVGSFLRVGPGLFEIDDFTVNHWFDGFSVLDKFEISKGKVTYMKKFLQSDAYKKAMVSKRPVFTEFGTKAHTDVTKNIFSRVISTVMPDLTDNCAINVINLHGQVFVCSETALIRQINPKTLDTLDKVDLTKVGATLISSHFLKDSRGDFYTMATEIFTSAHYAVIKVPAATDLKKPFKKAETLCTLSPSNKGPSSYHSFAATDNYIVFMEQPLIINMMKVISLQVKGRSLYESMDWQPHLMNTFNIIDKRTGKALPTKYITTKPYFVCHHVNCYEEDNQLVVDLVEYESPKLFDQMFLNIVRQDKFDVTDGGCALRVVLPLITDSEMPEEGKNLVRVKSAATAERRGDMIHVTGESLSERGYENPSINPSYLGRKYRYFYASGMIDGGRLRNSIVKVDTETGAVLVWKESTTSYPQEPHFVTRPSPQSEDDGVLLVPVSNTSASVSDALVILDALTLTEVGRASVSCHMPNLMHGLFIPTTNTH